MLNPIDLAVTGIHFLYIERILSFAYEHSQSLESLSLLELVRGFNNAKSFYKLSYFISKSAILGIPSWKPKRALPVLIERSKLGAIKSANYFAEKVISTSYQRNLAFTLLSESTLGFGISIVRPLR